MLQAKLAEAGTLKKLVDGDLGTLDAECDTRVTMPSSELTAAHSYRT